jgi:integrase
LRISTWERYEQICRKHIIPEMGHQELKNLSPTATQDLYRRKLNTLSPRTVQYIHVTLRRSLSQALKWNLVPKNVAGLVDPPKVTKEEMRPLTAEEVNVLFESVKDTPLEALYVLAATTGLRRGEMLALKWSDIDLDARTLYVRRNLSLTKNGPVLVPPKTTKGKRSIKLCKICIEDRS